MSYAVRAAQDEAFEEVFGAKQPLDSDVLQACFAVLVLESPLRCIIVPPVRPLNGLHNTLLSRPETSESTWCRNSNLPTN